MGTTDSVLLGKSIFDFHLQPSVFHMNDKRAYCKGCMFVEAKSSALNNISFLQIDKTFKRIAVAQKVIAIHKS
jgi:hypothetical protein